ncbi:FeoA family protein [Magnetococcales bacterium HHB-1]
MKKGSKKQRISLLELKSGETAEIAKLKASSELKSHLEALGFIPGVKVSVDRTAPLGDPRSYTLLGNRVTLRNEDAAQVTVLVKKSKKIVKAKKMKTIQRTLSDLNVGEKAIIKRLQADESMNDHLTALGFVQGVPVMVDRKAPLGDPRSYLLLGNRVSLRNEDAQNVVLD